MNSVEKETYLNEFAEALKPRRRAVMAKAGEQEAWLWNLCSVLLHCPYLSLHTATQLHKCISNYKV